MPSPLLRAAHSRARSAAVKGRVVAVVPVVVVFVVAVAGVVEAAGAEKDVGDGTTGMTTEGREIGEELLCVEDDDF